jgi:hypothetical protein
LDDFAANADPIEHILNAAREPVEQILNESCMDDANKGLPLRDLTLEIGGKAVELHKCAAHKSNIAINKVLANNL